MFQTNILSYCKPKITSLHLKAVIAQLGERYTKDLKVPGSIPGRGKILLALPFFLYDLRFLYVDNIK